MHPQSHSTPLGSQMPAIQHRGWSPTAIRIVSLQDTNEFTSKTRPEVGALPNSSPTLRQKAAEDCRTPRRFAFVRAPDSCASFWTAPVLWHFRPTKTALSRTKSRPRQRAMMRSLAKAEAQPRQGRHRCRNRHKQLPSSVRSGIVRRSGGPEAQPNRR